MVLNHSSLAQRHLEVRHGSGFAKTGRPELPHQSGVSFTIVLDGIVMVFKYKTYTIKAPLHQLRRLATVFLALECIF